MDDMKQPTQAEFKGWAKVEVMGRQSHVGYVETQAFGGAVLFRINHPEIAAGAGDLTECHGLAHGAASRDSG